MEEKSLSELKKCIISLVNACCKNPLVIILLFIKQVVSSICSFFLLFLLSNLASYRVYWCFNWHSPSDWSYAEAELKSTLGKSFLIYGNYIFFTTGSYHIFCLNHNFLFLTLKLWLIGKSCIAQLPKTCSWK